MSSKQWRLTTGTNGNVDAVDQLTPQPEPFYKQTSPKTAMRVSFEGFRLTTKTNVVADNINRSYMGVLNNMF